MFSPNLTITNRARSWVCGGGVSLAVLLLGACAGDRDRGDPAVGLMHPTQQNGDSTADIDDHPMPLEDGDRGATPAMNGGGISHETSQRKVTPDSDPSESNDPWEDVNRSVFAFNQDFDRFILRPITDTYRFLLPVPVQDSVHSFLNNVGSPLVFVNDVMQGEGSRAMDTLARFLINTTLGIGGLFDPASEVFHIDPHTEDFGQTLGTYGVSDSPYLVLPILGPSNLRDLTGRVVDFFIDPVSYWLRRQSLDGLMYTRLALDAVDKRNQNDKTIDQINGALDPYGFMRSAYRQNRRFHVENGVNVETEESPVPSEEDGLSVVGYGEPILGKGQKKDKN